MRVAAKGAEAGQPVVTSAEYPPGNTGGVGVSGTFTLAAPAGTDDITHYLYSFTAQGDVPATKATPPALNGQAVVSWSPSASGPFVLSVRSVDRAGNRSPILRYQIDVADYRLGVSGKIARWAFEDTRGTRRVRSWWAPPSGQATGSTTSQVIDEPRVFNSVLTAEDAHGLWNYASTIRVPRPSLFRTDKSVTVSAWAKPDVYDSMSHTVFSADGMYSPFLLTHRSEWKRFALLVFVNGGESRVYDARAQDAIPRQRRGAVDLPERHVDGVQVRRGFTRSLLVRGGDHAAGHGPWPAHRSGGLRRPVD